ncbi:hypothetical protein JTB14_024167 [Gonioctena quinquepunctata]|nr:hypothetical protein JTB14_024167 [Gonioctena quinquepunctata]
MTRRKYWSFSNRKFPQGAEKNDAILFFANHFKTTTAAAKTAIKSKKLQLKKDKDNIEPKKTRTRGKDAGKVLKELRVPKTPVSQKNVSSPRNMCKWKDTPSPTNVGK